MRFLIDEDLPRSTANLIQEFSHEGIDIRDVGLRGAPDAAIAQYAKNQELCLVTGDFDFANIRNYPPREYQGIVVLNIPRNATATYILNLLRAFLQQEQILNQLVGKLAIVEAGRVRLSTG